MNVWFGGVVSETPPRAGWWSSSISSWASMTWAQDPALMFAPSRPACRHAPLFHTACIYDHTQIRAGIVCNRLCARWRLYSWAVSSCMPSGGSAPRKRARSETGSARRRYISVQNCVPQDGISQCRLGTEGSHESSRCLHCANTMQNAVIPELRKTMRWCDRGSRNSKTSVCLDKGNNKNWTGSQYPRVYRSRVSFTVPCELNMTI